MGKISNDERPGSLRLGLCEIFFNNVGVGLIDAATFDVDWEDAPFRAGVPGLEVKRIRTAENATLKFTHPQIDVDFFSRALPGAVVTSGGASLARTLETITFDAATSTETLDVATSLGAANVDIDAGTDSLRIHTGGSAPTVYVETTDYTVDRAACTVTRTVASAIPIGTEVFVDYLYTDSSATAKVVKWGALECQSQSFVQVRVHSLNPESCVPTDIVGFKAIPTGTLSIGFALAEYTKPEVTLALIADVSRAKGDRLFRVNIGGAVYSA